jgi:hypothetical protein
MTQMHARGVQESTFTAKNLIVDEIDRAKPAKATHHRIYHTSTNIKHYVPCPSGSKQHSDYAEAIS